MQLPSHLVSLLSLSIASPSVILMHRVACGSDLYVCSEQTTPCGTALRHYLEVNMACDSVSLKILHENIVKIIMFILLYIWKNRKKELYTNYKVMTKQHSCLFGYFHISTHCQLLFVHMCMTFYSY